MIRSLDNLYAREDRDLAPYAIKHARTRGRHYPEAPHPFRTDYQRDRDRVLHSRPFRRLEYKTQVFLNDAGDHYRTRLTHTIEVAGITRTVARALCLNEDLAETIALAHDLGHTPFGHTGERRLNALLKNEGGFDHNDQALRIIDALEKKYPDYDGLNMTWEVRAGLIKHRPSTGVTLDNTPLPPQPSLESQVADVADDLTYYGHDVDDGLESGLFTEKELCQCQLWREATEQAQRAGLTQDDPTYQTYAVRCLINSMVGDLVRHSNARLESLRVDCPEKAQNLPERVATFSPEFAVKTKELRQFLYDNMYFAKTLLDVNDWAAWRVESLFHFYVQHPESMGENTQKRFKLRDPHRAVADYIAGMTDRYALKAYERFCL